MNYVNTPNFLRKAVSTYLIVSVVIVAIVAAGVGTYLYITYSQKPTQQTTNVITIKHLL